jgi:hypothetical protein
MKELQKITDDLEGTFSYYSPDYYDPLLEYVEPLANKYRPVNEEDVNCGFYVSRATGDFVTRYLSDQVDKRKLDKYLQAKEILDTIQALGYDIEKFWYLTLFILDYSTGACLNCFKQNSTPKENIDNLSKRMLQNIESIDLNKSRYADLKSPMRLVLEIDGKHKTVIEDTNSLLYIAAMLTSGLEEFGENSNLNYSFTTMNHIIKDGKFEFEYDTLSNSILIWHFAKMFIDFFELKPPVKGTSKKGSLISLNKKLLISRLIYIIGISKNESFYNSDETLKGYLKQYRDLKINTINGYYL